MTKEQVKPCPACGGEISTIITISSSGPHGRMFTHEASALMVDSCLSCDYEKAYNDDQILDMRDNYEKTIAEQTQEIDRLNDIISSQLTSESLKSDKPLKQQVQELQSKVEKAVITLKFYANREEWGDKGGQFETWDLVFNSSSIDGHGYEKAEQTLKEILEDA